MSCSAVSGEDVGRRLEEENGGWRMEDGGRVGSAELEVRDWKPGEVVLIGCRLTWAVGMTLFDLLDTAVSAVL